MKSQWLVFISITFLYGCQCDENADQLQTSLTIAGIKLRLATAKDLNNLITKIDHNNQSYTITFEDGDSFWASTRLIDKINYDSTLWLATFQFSDYTSQSSNFLGELNFDETILDLNPYLNSPLTAVAQIEMPVKGKFKVAVKGKPSGGITMEKTFPYYREAHELPILGLYENYTNQIEFVFVNANNKTRCSKVLTLTTPSIQNKPHLEIDIIKNQLSQEYKGLYIVSDLKLGFDQKGEVRWYDSGDGQSFFGQLENGNFITNELNNLNFFEMTWLGQCVKKYNAPNGLHHEIVEMPTGNFLVASHSPLGHPLEDVLIEVDRSSGSIIKSWDFKKILDPLRATLPDTWTGDWLHINALYYDESDNSIVISGRSQCAVVKIDYATGVIKWILGNHNQWADVYKSYLLKPVNDQGIELDISRIDFWPYGQHAIQRLSNGNLLLYDNGDYRGFYDDPDVSQASYTRIAEYKINEVEKTVELVWQFDNDKTVFTKYTGYVQHFPASRLAAFMWSSETTPKIIELDDNNEIIFEATINRGKNSFYRTLKVDVYQLE